ncbi:MAG TPA: hypothetical protein VFP96_02510 [Candidatus Acidoferrum sp.]|nr:hypothetical protein [Candidatus Acidoferrum sp.]
MKRVLLLLSLAFGFAAPATFAQSDDHIQAGLYADYFRLSQTKTNFAGVGARFGVKVYKHVSLEAEMSYDFNKVLTEGFTDNSTVPPTITVQRTDVRALHGLIGPKVALGHNNFHPFVTLKGGFNHFFLDNRPATAGTAISSIQDLRSNDLTGVLYPGGGLEGHLGPVGLRLDVGDEIYFAGGAHHNLRVAFGPYIRF